MGPCYYPDTKGRARAGRNGFDCTEMQEGRPWTYQTDYYGIMRGHQRKGNATKIETSDKINKLVNQRMLHSKLSKEG